MVQKLIIPTFAIIFATLLAHHSLAQEPKQWQTSADIIAMPDDDEKFRTLDDYIHTRRDTDTLLYYIEEQVQLAQRLEKQDFLIRAYINRGTVFERLNDYQRAEASYEKALKYANETFDRKSAADCYNEIASILTRSNNYNKAIEYFNKALQYYKETGDVFKITDVYRNMGRQCLRFHLYKTAKAHFDKALHLDSISGDAKALGLDLYCAGRSDFLQFIDIDSATFLHSGISNIKKSMQILKKTGNRWALQKCYEQLMQMYVSMYATGNQKYLTLAKESAHYYRLLNSTLSEELYKSKENITIQITDADLLAMDAKYDEAIQQLRQIETKTDQDDAQYSQHKVYLYKSLIWILRAAGDYKSAVDYFDKLKTTEENTFNRDFALRSIRTTDETEFSEEIRQQEATNQQQSQTQHDQIKEQQTHTIYFVVSIILASVLVTIIWRILKRKRQHSKILAEQKSEILNKNNELHAQNQTIESQRDEILKQRDEIEAQKTQLATANERVEASIRYTLRIQKASMPSPDKMKQIFGDFMAYWKPLNGVSRDFFWATQIKHYKLITAADCSGHGVPGAFMSMLGISKLNDIAAQKDIEGTQLTAAAILEELHHKIMDAMLQSDNQRRTQDGLEIAFCIIDTQNQQIQFAGANCPLWIVRDGRLTEHQPDNRLLGVQLDAQTTFTNNTIPIQKGDAIYIGSDGIQNQNGGAETEQKFGIQRLRKLLETNASKPFDKQHDIIEAAMDDWRKKTNGDDHVPQLDDQILIGIRI